MSTHYIHKFKYSHSKRLSFFKRLINQGKAEIIDSGQCYFVVKTTNGNDYRISRRGRPIKINKAIP